MAATICIRDSVVSRDTEDYTFDLLIADESMTVRELIRERIYQEVDDFNRSLDARSADMETWRQRMARLLGGKQRADSLPIERVDWREPFGLAISAFEKMQLLVIVGERQTMSLDEVVRLKPETEVIFLRLVPLAGG